MEMKKFWGRAVVALILTGTTALGVTAANNRKEIKAYLEYDKKVMYNLEEKTLLDTEGTRLYPITYNGNLYLPVSALGELFNVRVTVDKDTGTVFFGKSGEALPFIDSFMPLYLGHNCIHRQSTDIKKKAFQLGNTTYNSYICYYAYKHNKETYRITYDLGEKYETFQCDVYCDKKTSFDIVGDDGKVLKTVSVDAGSAAKTITVDVTGQSQMAFIPNENSGSYSGGHRIYILNATID